MDSDKIVCLPLSLLRCESGMTGYFIDRMVLDAGRIVSFTNHSPNDDALTTHQVEFGTPAELLRDSNGKLRAFGG